MQYMRKFIILTLVVSAIFPAGAIAATKKVAAKPVSRPTPLAISAWVAYWDKGKSSNLAADYIDKFDVIDPFSYEVDSDGTINDRMRLAASPWTDLYMATGNSKKHTQIIPTILWSDPDAIHKTLTDPTLRANHIDSIISLTNYGMFKGVDIDYENKKFETRSAFSSFLTELSKKLHAKGKVLYCDVEARTPPEDRFPDNKNHISQYVNDYKVIGKVCDEVRLMTYDQQDDDRALLRERAKTGVYAAIGDPLWIERVVNLTAKDIPKNKIMIGIGTYGAIFELGKDDKGRQTLKHIRAITYGDAIVKALQDGSGPISPIRDERTGERIFTYKKGDKEYICVFNDKESVARKIALAKKLKVKGVAFFKVDAKTDQTIFQALK